MRKLNIIIAFSLVYSFLFQLPINAYTTSFKEIIIDCDNYGDASGNYNLSEEELDIIHYSNLQNMNRDTIQYQAVVMSTVQYTYKEVKRENIWSPFVASSGQPEKGIIFTSPGMINWEDSSVVKGSWSYSGSYSGKTIGFSISYQPGYKVEEKVSGSVWVSSEYLNKYVKIAVSREHDLRYYEEYISGYGQVTPVRTGRIITSQTCVAWKLGIIVSPTLP